MKLGSFFPSETTECLVPMVNAAWPARIFGLREVLHPIYGWLSNCSDINQTVILVQGVRCKAKNGRPALGRRPNHWLADCEGKNSIAYARCSATIDC